MPDIELASYQGQQEITEAINNLTLSAAPQKAVWFDNVASMVAYDLPVGVTAATRGYHTVNDGGNASYYIREVAVGDVEDGGSIILLDNGNVAELITDGTVNVRQFGAKGDGVTDDTSAFQNMFAGNKFQRYRIPKGIYSVGKQICNYSDDTALTQNVEIFGDGYNLTKLKLRDNVITADNERLITLRANPSYNVDVCVHDMHIDMNRTNNHALVDSSGDEYALQHCHAIGIECYAVKQINVLAYNLSFFDLIADGIGMAGTTDKSFATIMVHNIISKGRQGTRSDVCVTGDFDSLIASDCDLDCFETEVNAFTTGNNRKALISNVSTRLWFDIGAKVAPNNNIYPEYYVVNCKCYGILACRYSNIHYDNCELALGVYYRISNGKVVISNSTIKQGTISSDYYPSDGQWGSGTVGWFVMTYKDNCSLHLHSDKIIFDEDDTVNLIVKESPGDSSNRAYADVYDLIIDGCDIEINSARTTDVCSVRAGDIILSNNRIKLANGISFIKLGKIISNITCTLRNNTIIGSGFCVHTYGSNVTDYVTTLYSSGNNVNSVDFYSFNDITSRRGGSGTSLDVVEIDTFQRDSAPSAGKWLKGQVVYNTSPSAGGNVGWVCTASGSQGTWKGFGAIES